jgi:poly(3-hydroxybutyrate) depolymerase
LAFFVTRNGPTERADFLEILEDFIGMDEIVQDSGMIGAVALPGVVTRMDREWIGWQINNQEDEEYFVAALDTLEKTFNINRSRVHLFGSHASGGYATHFAYLHSGRIASTANQAGYNPFDPWPSSWLRPVSGMFIHDPRDEFQSEAQIEDSALMFEAAGAYVERFYDLDSPALDGHHDWDAEDIRPRLAAFQAEQCIPPQGP